ncbi:hypothetical protein C8F04DRAFT_1190333 [Mycena alexandri]|uniref:Uncharacterized protein n=1 Tax=Mycena alexandri TaxID=1745969 RepID=A0AAD6SFF8_9AGAR|nr:hypothetical protein C8F04DRAFT_1190333 [Mycena alexandri]
MLCLLSSSLLSGSKTRAGLPLSLDGVRCGGAAAAWASCLAPERALCSASLHRSSSALEHLEDRWSEEEREKGMMAWVCPGWEVERSRVEEGGVQLRDHNEPEYTPSEGKGGQPRDRNKPEHTPVLRDDNVRTFDGAGVREAEGGGGGADEVVDAREAIEENTQDALVRTAWRVQSVPVVV